MGATSPVNEGSSSFYTVSLSKPSDAAGDLPTLRYAFDCGTGSNYGPFSSLASANCPAPDGPRQYTVRAKIIDKDGGSSEYVGSPSVLNVAPSVDTPQLRYQSTIGNKPGPDVIIAFDFTDPGAGDAVNANGWQVTVSWGDGTTTPTFGRPGGQFTASHRYGQSGKFMVKVEARDKDGGIGTSKTLSIRVG